MEPTQYAIYALTDIWLANIWAGAIVLTFLSGGGFASVTSTGTIRVSEAGVPENAPENVPENAVGLAVEMRAGDDVFRPAQPVSFTRKLAGGMASISMKMAAEDAAEFADFTRRHQGEVVEMSVCGQVLMAPRVVAPILGGQISLTGLDVERDLRALMQTGCP